MPKRLQGIIDSLDISKYIDYQLASGAMSENGGTTWVSAVEIGTPGQKLNLMLDSGTLNTWLTDARCSTQACQQHASFNSQTSSTFVPADEPNRTVNFGPWGSMEVAFGFDVCHLQTNSDIKLLENMKFMLALDYSGINFAELVADGGLAIPSIADKEASALVNRLYAQGLISFPIASFFLDKAANCGACRIGALNPELFDWTSLHRLPLVTPAGGADLAYLWAVAMDSLAVGSDQVFGPADHKQLVIDSGSSFFKGGKAIIDRLIQAVTKDHSLPTRFTDPQELQNFEPIRINLSGKDYVIPPSQYFVRIKGEYVLAIQVLVGLPDEMLLVGQIFMETVYTIFDFGIDLIEERAIYLAKPKLIKNPQDTLSGNGIIGDWQNQFGSVMSIQQFSPEGVFKGSYRSHTGATGIYPLVGTADPSPDDTQTFSFAVTWRSLQGAYNPSWHWVSGFAGYRSIQQGTEVIQGTFLLQRNLTEDTPGYEATSVSSLTFKRIDRLNT